MLSEASLLFSYELHHLILDLLEDVADRKRQWGWGKLSDFQQRQLCIHLLIQRSPKLQAFLDYTHHDYQHRLGREFDPVFSLGQLREVSIRCPKPVGPDILRPAWLEKVSRMQHLHSLELEGTGMHQDATSQRSLGDFHNLQYLTLEGSIQLLSAIFKSLRRDMLITVSIYVDIPRPELTGAAYRLKDCIETLVSRTERSLRHIHIFPAMSGAGLTLPVDMSFMAMIQPLTRIRQLLIFTTTLIRCAVTDEDIVTLAKSWPELQILRIKQTPLQTGETCLSIRSLVELATRCPLLRELSLRVPFKHIPPPDSILTLNHNLAELYLEDPEFDDQHQIKQIAQLVHRLFPRLDESLIRQEKDKGSRWWKVVEQVVALREVNDGKSNDFVEVS